MYYNTPEQEVRYLTNPLRDRIAAKLRLMADHFHELCPDMFESCVIDVQVNIKLYEYLREALLAYHKLYRTIAFVVKTWVGDLPTTVCFENDMGFVEYFEKTLWSGDVKQVQVSILGKAKMEDPISYHDIAGLEFTIDSIAWRHAREDLTGLKPGPLYAAFNPDRPQDDESEDENENENQD